MLIAVDSGQPCFASMQYPVPIKLVGHEREVPKGHAYMTHDGKFKLWVMSADRIPIPRGSARDINEAIYKIRRKST